MPSTPGKLRYFPFWLGGLLFLHRDTTGRLYVRHGTKGLGQCSGHTLTAIPNRFSAIGMISSMAEECGDPTVKLPNAISLCVPVGGIAGLFFVSHNPLTPSTTMKRKRMKRLILTLTSRSFPSVRLCRRSRTSLTRRWARHSLTYSAR